MSAPDSIRRLLDATATRSRRLSTRARSRHCGRCEAGVLTALTAELLGLVATVDPIPLSPLGEALALLGDRTTFHLRWWGGRYELHDRYHWDIQGCAAGADPRADVLAQHVCHAPPLPAADRGLVAGPAANPLCAREVGDEPPF